MDDMSELQNKTTCKINGQDVCLTHSPAASAVNVIREQVGLTGTKLVCGAGVCGACTVLVDGQPMTSCLIPACSLDGTEVQTVENFAADRLHPIQIALLAHDGLQCGFCTPGFVIEGIAFFDRWRKLHGTECPSRATIAAAMCGHLCRCAAYSGIYDAIQAACTGKFDDADTIEFPRHDALAKVTGEARYTVDVHYDNMLLGKMVGSPYAHAKIESIDYKQAESIPGIKAIIDVLDDPHRVVRFVGQPILAIAGVNATAIEKAIQTINIEFDVRPFVICPIEAESPDSPTVYPEKKKNPANASEGPIPPGSWNGNIRTPLINLALSWRKARAKKALKQARAGQAGLHLIEHTYQTPAQTHTALEPHTTVAKWDGPDRLTVHASTQTVHLLGKEIARHFNLRRENVVVHAEYIGGAFGAKQGLMLEQKASIELARKAGAPVKIAYDRREELVLGGFRPTARIEFSLVVDDDGNQRGITAKAYGCCGTAVQSQNAPWIRLAYSGPKHCQDFDVTTNWGGAKPFRGPCGPSATWALEQAVDEAANRLNIDPVALRKKWDKSNPVRDSLYDWVESIPEWKNRGNLTRGTGRFKTGIGFAIGNWFNAFHNATRVQVNTSPDGVVASCAVQDMGQGSRSVIAAAVAEELGVPVSSVQVDIGNSQYVMGPISSASRTTASVYPTATEAARKLKKKLVTLARTKLQLKNPQWVAGGITFEGGQMKLPELVRKLPPIAVNSGKRGSNGWWDILGKLPSGDLGISFYLKMTRSVCVIETEIDSRLGRVRPQKVWMGLAVGKITNPELARSQVCGGVMQSLGFTLTEERIFDPTTGTLLSCGLEDYRIPGIGEVPEIEIHFCEQGFESMRGGACGMSELSTIPIPAAVGNSVFHATGWRPTTLPLTPERVLGNV